jgi:membrane-bound metal-dependent hydrolase YbcI (DUF457 family)
LYFPVGLHFTLGNFRQHITCSTATGIAVAGIAYHFGFSPPACLVSAGLCSFAGMLPDIDSDTSKSFQECIYLTAGIACVLAASRLRHYGIDPDLALLGGALIFLLIRFGLGTLIKKITTHRGMIHSIPMALLSGEVAFFVVTGTVEERLVKAAALTMGFLSHLILDEVYSIDSTGTALRIKKSFGTALKWTNPKKHKQVTVLYASIICLGYIACMDPEVAERINSGMQQFADSESTKSTLQPVQCEIQRAAAEFLSQQGLPNFDLQPLEALPAPMQYGNDWNQDRPIQPARILLP